MMMQGSKIQSRPSQKIKAKVMISFQEKGKNGGPYVSHKRICELLADKYEFVPLIVPPGRLGVFNRKLQKNLRQQIQKADPDMIHIHGLQLVGFQLVRAAKREKKPVVLAVRGFTAEAVYLAKWKKLIVRACEIYTLKKSDIVYCVSDYVRKQKFIIKNARDLYGTIYNMSYISHSEGKRDVRKQLGFSDEDVVIVSTGRITQEKGFGDLCEVIIKGRFKNNVKFLIVGNGEYLDTFKKKIADNNLDKQVFFLGYQKDVERILKESDIFVLCTWHETLSNSILEAQKEGLPVVATNVGGIPEIIQNGKNGYLVEKRAEAQIIDRLKLLSENPQLRKEMGANGKQKIKEKFSEEKIEKQIEEVYAKLLEKRQ